MKWARPPLPRDQLILFATRLDDALPPDHAVRLFDELLSHPAISWQRWEAKYCDAAGQPAIPPKIMASILLYGLLTKIRSSRALEDALQVRTDFMWLAEGRSIDYSTFCLFRRNHHDELKLLFRQIGQVAREAGLLKLDRLAFDGTRVRANNRRSGTRTPEELRREAAELDAKYERLSADADAADLQDQEAFDADARPQKQSRDERRARVTRALEELARAEAAGEKLPKRLPITDPESRVMPNKEGGFAPNYTPTAMVDVDSGLIVAATVLGVHNEDAHLVPSLDEVQREYGLAQPPAEVLADGLMATGANLAELEARGVTLYSPCDLPDPENPALRPDPTQPVTESDRDRLPTKPTTRNGVKGQQLDKTAFAYDAEHDCYWCPQGQPLKYANTTSEETATGRRIRKRYLADPAACAECPLRALCLSGKAKSRQINREQYEEHRERHAQRMATPEAEARYQARRHPGERPFAEIKQQFGLRQFLLRSLEKVQQEWLWATSAFNLKTLMTQWPRSPEFSWR
jgi:transposase